ncbi:WPP domain-interacting tail-anchored protein 1-like [Curcuma longa]|uniref:WPP domain-interacting tail-anchored protein 1-like n=1 Tax=Curcuma longa TaxID=136217 RepID=UPI003D9F16B0
MAIDEHEDNYLQEDERALGINMNEGNATEALTRIELNVAYSSEKLLNLEILLMLVADRANDFEAWKMEHGDILAESVKKFFESDILCGILCAEVKELQSFMSFLPTEIMETYQNLSNGENLEAIVSEVGEKLFDAEKTVRKLQDSIADIQKQSLKFESILALCHVEARLDEDQEFDNGHLSSICIVDQQRSVLKMLDESLARELDLENKLSDTRSNEKDLKLQLLYAEAELEFIKESIEIYLERALEAENTAEVLLAISKEFSGRLQVVQFSLNSSLRRENELKSHLNVHAEESTKEKELKARTMEADDGSTGTIPEIISLKEKVKTLEEQLRQSHAQMQLAEASVESSHKQQSFWQSELGQKENVIKGLRADVLRSENRAESAEGKYVELQGINIKLNEEPILLQKSNSERTNLSRSSESDMQLEHARASVEALKEKQSGLYDTIDDMGIVIEELKIKVSKAESRAENAESKCTLLTETNLELNEELGFLRGKLEYMETSMHQAEGAKIATAKDIGIRTKLIGDLVMKLALERERLQLEISTLIKKNRALSEKLKRNSSSYKGTNNETLPGAKSSVERPAESFSRDIQTENLTAGISEKHLVTTLSAEEKASGSDSKIETVRNIEAAQLDPKYLCMAILVLFVAVLTFYAYQQESNRVY